MTQPRKALVSIDDTPYYHIVSRCVRRAFLCGKDTVSGRCYEHRRDWVEQRIHLLSSLFAIDIAAYAVMSNHYHLVVKLAPDQAEHWSLDEVLTRWTALYKGPLVVQNYLAGKPLSKAEFCTLEELVTLYRERLSSLSWFMKCLNEPIARQANKEDGCTGHFFEGRFYSQALLSEEALLSCMAYVDLNPIRANIAETPESSDYTSIKERIQPNIDLSEAIQEQTKQTNLLHDKITPKPLLRFEGAVSEKQQAGILFLETDYLALVDTTGRCVRQGKRGSINTQLSPILTRLGLSHNEWLKNATAFEKIYQSRFARQRKKPDKKSA